MHFRCLVVVAAVSLLAALPAQAQNKTAPDRFESIQPEALFKGVIREDDVTLFFNHLRQSMAAAARGEAVPESEALRRRGEAIQRDLAVRGGTLMDALLSAIETEAKRALREAPPRPAPGSI